MTWANMKSHYFIAYTSIYLDVGGLRASGVGLLALLTWPLPLGLLAYHVYLIWAGMTTNESSKWSDWSDDMAEGVVFLGYRREETMQIQFPTAARTQGSGTAHSSSSTSPVPTPPETPTEEEEPLTTWPLESRHILIRTRDGQPPRKLPPRIKSVAKSDSFQRIWNLTAVENVYDLGLWDNLKEALLN